MLKFWPGIDTTIEAYCKDSECCMMSKVGDLQPRSFMGHLMATKPSDILAEDFTILEPSSNVQENMLILTDVFSK